MTVARLGITIWLSCRPAVTNRSSCSHWTRASCSWDLCRQFFITTRLESNLLQIVHSILQPGKRHKTFQLDPFKYWHFKKVISEKNFLACYVCFSYVRYYFNTCTDFFWKIINITAKSKECTERSWAFNIFLSTNPASFHGTPVSYLARSCLLQIESSALTMVLAWVKCMCWNWLFLRQTSTAFFLRSSRGTFDSAPMSFNSISAVTFTPRASINTHSI